MELLPKHGCENYKSVSRLFKERYGCSMKEMQKRYEKEKGDRPIKGPVGKNQKSGNA